MIQHNLVLGIVPRLSPLFVLQAVESWAGPGIKASLVHVPVIFCVDTIVSSPNLVSGHETRIQRLGLRLYHTIPGPGQEME